MASSSSDSQVDRLADLLELRRKLVAASELAEPSALPAIARELRLVGVEIADLAPAEEVDLADDLAARRAARISGADKAGRSATNE